MRLSSTIAFAKLIFACLLIVSLPATACNAPPVAQLIGGDQFDYVSPEGFPAISKSGEEVAILTSTHPLASTYFVDVRSTTTGEVLKKFIIVPTGETPTAEGVEAAITDVNAYLLENTFTPMRKLFALAYPNTPNWPKAFEEANEGYRVSIDYETKTLSIFHEQGDARALLFKPNAQSLCGSSSDCGDGYTAACGDGVREGVPSAGWVDKNGHLAVVVVGYPASKDGCEGPDVWHVIRLRDAE